MSSWKILLRDSETPLEPAAGTSRESRGIPATGLLYLKLRFEYLLNTDAFGNTWVSSGDPFITHCSFGEHHYIRILDCARPVQASNCRD